MITDLFAASIDKHKNASYQENFISSCLRLSQQNDKPMVLHQKILYYFTCMIEPPISLPDYIRRIEKYAICIAAGENATLITFLTRRCALDYITRLYTAYPQIFSPLSIHMIIASSYLLAIKWLNDKTHHDTFHAEVFGVTVRELKKLETGLLNALNYNIFSRAEFPEEMDELLRDSPSAPIPESPRTLHQPLSLPTGEKGSHDVASNNPIDENCRFFSNMNVSDNSQPRKPTVRPFKKSIHSAGKC